VIASPSPATRVPSAAPCARLCTTKRDTAQIAGSGTDSAATTANDALRKKVEETNRRISDLAKAADPGQTVESVQARTALENLRTSLEGAMKKVAEVVATRAPVVARYSWVYQKVQPSAGSMLIEE